MKEFTLSDLTKHGYNYIVIGKKPLYDLYNKNLLGPKFHTNIIEVITNATLDFIQSLQSEDAKYKIKNDKLLLVKKDFIYTFKYVPFKSVNELTEKLFTNNLLTINNLYINSKGEYIDYKYKYRNKQISSMHDLEQKILRIINIKKKELIDAPEKILEAICYLSELGFNFESQTLNFITSNLSLLEKLSGDQIRPYIDKILSGKFVDEALLFMNKNGFFDLKINDINGNSIEFLSFFKDIDDYSKLKILNQNKPLTNIQIWATIIKDLDIDILNHLLLSGLINDIEKEKIIWIIENFNIIYEENLKLAIFNSRSKHIKEEGLMYLRDLIIKLSEIHNALDKNTKSLTDQLMISFCSRPYFNNQIKIPDSEFISMANEEEGGDWLDIAKEKLLKKLVLSNPFPKEMNLYLEVVSEAIEEAFGELLMKESGLL